MSDVLIGRREHVATITLNRPERLNAISGPMLQQLSQVLVEFDSDRDVRVIVLTGAGRGFCSGLDLQSAGDNDLGGSAGAFRIEDSPPFVLRRIETPVLCALNGPAAGYGMDLALGCDLVIASESASLAPPIRRAAVAESGGTWLLPRLIGWQKACEVLLLGRKLAAADLARLGLVNLVVPDEEFEGVVAAVGSRALGPGSARGPGQQAADAPRAGLDLRSQWPPRHGRAHHALSHHRLRRGHPGVPREATAGLPGKLTSPFSQALVSGAPPSALLFEFGATTRDRGSASPA